LDYFKFIFKEFEDEVDFLMVYIREAHAADQWPLGDVVSIKQHATLQERLEAAQNFVEQFEFPARTVVDSMENLFNKSFLAWPERYYIYEGHQLSSISCPANEFGFDRLELRARLAGICNKDLVELPSLNHPVFSDVPINKDTQRTV